MLHGYDEAFCDALPPQYSDIVSCAWDPRRSWQPTGPFWDTMQKRWWAGAAQQEELAGALTEAGVAEAEVALGAAAAAAAAYLVCVLARSPAPTLRCSHPHFLACAHIEVFSSTFPGLRHREITARMLLMGYNVMSLDSGEPPGATFPGVAGVAWAGRRPWLALAHETASSARPRCAVQARGPNVPPLLRATCPPADVAVLDDPYKYLKHPVFAK